MFEHTPIPYGGEHASREVVADTSDADERVWHLTLEARLVDDATGEVARDGASHGELGLREVPTGFDGDEAFTLDEALERYNSLDEEAIARYLDPEGRSDGHERRFVKSLLHVDETSQVTELACAYDFRTYVPEGASAPLAPGRPSPDELERAGALYAQGASCLKSDSGDEAWQRGVELLAEAADLGDSRAQFDLYNIYLTGSGGERDEARALEYLRRAAEGGHPSSAGELAVAYYGGELGLDADGERAFAWCVRAVSLGDWASIPLLARFAVDESVGQFDAMDAVDLYKLGARKGNASCQDVLGFLYECGQGVEQDILQAVRWYREAARQGNADSMFALGRVMLENPVLVIHGKSDEERQELCLDLINQAADAGSEEACAYLGR